MEVEEEVQWQEVVLVCDTPGCGNEGIPIVLTVPLGCSYTCGACSTSITLVEELPEESEIPA
jgi:hypothetical protein